MNQPIIETLFMVSEYVSGPAQIAGMILAGMRPILWAPSAIVIDKAFEIGHSILSSRDLLGLIEMGLVRIAARERWLTDRNHRQNYRWDGAKWFSPFDEQVLKWFKEDIGKPVPRVVGFPPQDGTDWALAQRNRQDNEAKKRIKRAGFLLQEGLLPDGLRERANEVDSPEKKVDIVLRDIRNTEVARDRLGKPILVTAPYSTDAMATLFEDLTLGHHCDDQQVSPELLVEFADLATSIVSGTIKDAKELEKRYRSCLDIGLARLMAKLLVGDQISLAERLAHEVRDSQRAEFWRPLLANLKFRSPHRLTLAGVLLGALSSAVAGKSTTGMRSIIGQKIQNLISDLPDREQLRRGLFLTFHGAEKLEYQQMEVLRRRFKELSRKKRKLSVPLRAEDATSFPKPDINEPGTRLATKLFISYAREDSSLVQEFRKRLLSMERYGIISVWIDERLEAGRWDDQIKQELITSDIVLFFVSNAFLSSSYIMSTEVPETLKREAEGSCLPIPVLLYDVDIKTTPFPHLMFFPSQARPVSAWENRDDAWDDVIGAIRRTVLTAPHKIVA